MTLIIGTTPHAQWQSLSPLLNQLGWQEQQDDPQTWYQKQGATARHPEGARYLLLHTRPESAIAHALDEGIAPEQALEEWLKSATELLRTYKSRRKHAVMVDIAGAAECPDQLLEWLKQNHSAFFDAASDVAQAARPQEPIKAPSELNLMIATQLVAQSSELQGLLPQLEACSVPVSDEHYAQPTVDVMAVYGQLSEQLEHKENTVERLKTRLEENEKRLSQAHKEKSSTEQSLKGENELLLTQLHKVQEELENYYHKHQSGSQANDKLNGTLKGLQTEKQALEAENTRLESRVERLETENQHLSDDLKAAKDAKSQTEASEQDLKEESELILSQLFQVQEELEKRYLNSKANDELAELKQQAEQALAKTEKQLANNQGELDRSRKEHQQTLAELFHTQQELEQAAFKIEGLANELSQRNEKVDDLEGQIQSKNEKLRRFSEEKKQLKARLKLVQDALVHEQAEQGSSALAKMAKPLRKLRRSHRLVEQQVHLVEGSELFDRGWYAEQYPDVAGKFTNLAEHYVRHGGQEQRDPGPHFSSSSYLEKNPDVVESGLNPLVHFLLHGKAEGRKI